LDLAKTVILGLNSANQLEGTSNMRCSIAAFQRIVRGLIVSAFAALAAATAASNLSAAGKTEKVLLASGLGPPYIWYMTAVDKGFMKKNGVNAEYKIFPSGVEAIIAVGAGEAHVTNGSCSTVMRARANGSKILVVARDILNPSEHKLIAAAGIGNPEDLKGKKVGMLTGSSTDWYASKYLKAFGLSQGTGPDKVEIVSIAAPEWIPALQRGDIAAFFGWEPWVSKATQIVAGAHQLHNGGDNGLFILMNCLVFNEDWVKSDPESALATMKGILEAHDAVQADKKAAADLAAAKMRIPAEELLQQAGCCSFKVDFTQDFEEHAREAAQWAQSKGMLKQENADAILKDVMAPGTLKQAAPDRVTVR
jgi:ABC-type nitrate/sulfonate/bicarbonate transport system substrate-binding protein